MYNKSFTLETPTEGLINITAQVKSAVAESGVSQGLCVVFCPHTTGGITVNENADPDVKQDVILGLNTAFPDDSRFMHFEGNSSAHLKSSCVGCQQTFILEDGSLYLGRWQGIYFCEFDGPKRREFRVSVLP